MNIDWALRGEPLDDEIQDRIGHQLARLSRFLREPTDARIVVRYEGPAHQRVGLDIVVTSPEGVFKGSAEGHDVVEVAREALNRVEVQAQRVHDKLREGRRQSGPAVALEPEIEV